METRTSPAGRVRDFRFEPTYEEWKLPSRLIMNQQARSFEPTYEEWKQAVVIGLALGLSGFEPTYEEWKPK